MFATKQVSIWHQSLLNSPQSDLSKQLIQEHIRGNAKPKDMWYIFISTAERCSKKTSIQRFPSHLSPTYRFEHSKPFYGDLKQPKADQADQCRPWQINEDQGRLRQTKVDQGIVGRVQAMELEALLIAILGGTKKHLFLKFNGCPI